MQPCFQSLASRLLSSLLPLLKIRLYLKNLGFVLSSSRPFVTKYDTAWRNLFWQYSTHVLQLHPWLTSFSLFEFISNDLYVTKLGQVWREVSSSVNCFRHWGAENSHLCVKRTNCDSFARFPSSKAFLLPQCAFLVHMWRVKSGGNKIKRPIKQRKAGAGAVFLD